MVMIRDLAELAGTLGAAHETVESIAKRLFKDTRCGIVFDGHEHGISVAGYAEGTDAECQQHCLDFPFTDEEFDAAVKVADEEGCDLFDRID